MISDAAREEAKRLLLDDTWAELHVFTQNESLFVLPHAAASLQPENCRTHAGLFTSREYAIRAGILINGVRYAVHQFETTKGVGLVYGRAGNAVSGAGACVGRVRRAGTEDLYVAVIYKFPSNSANSVLKLIEYANEFLRPPKIEQQWETPQIEATGTKL